MCLEDFANSVIEQTEYIYIIFLLVGSLRLLNEFMKICIDLCVGKLWYCYLAPLCTTRDKIMNYFD